MMAPTLPARYEVETKLATLVKTIAVAAREGTRSGIPPALAMRVRVEFDAFARTLDAVLRDLSGSEAARLGADVQAALTPAMLASENAARWLAKPRGHAGDYLTLEWIYDDQPRGHGVIGTLIDRCFLDLPMARAIRSRRELLAAEIRATLKRCHDRPSRVACLGAGPAREVFDVYGVLDEPRALVTTLVESDVAALDACDAERCDRGVEKQVRLVACNPIEVATGHARIELVDQDLVYSACVLESLDDLGVVRLFDTIHQMLRPGGRALLGTFHPRNPARAIMEHVVDWRLAHRDEEALHALAAASAFAAPCTKLAYEPHGVALFAELVKV